MFVRVTDKNVGNLFTAHS